MHVPLEDINTLASGESLKKEALSAITLSYAE
jgi:hypothetical protein